MYHICMSIIIYIYVNILIIVYIERRREREICIYWAIYYPFKDSYISSGNRLSSRNRNGLLGDGFSLYNVP